MNEDETPPPFPCDPVERYINALELRFQTLAGKRLLRKLGISRGKALELLRADAERQIQTRTHRPRGPKGKL